MSKRIVWVLLAMLGMSVLIPASCNKKPTEPEVLNITCVSRDRQEGLLGSTLDSLVVLVTDSKGRPVEGRRVDFEVVQGEGKLSVKSTLTDASGKAYTVLTLGNRSGTVKVKATLFGHDKSVVFTATAYAPASIPCGGEGLSWSCGGRGDSEI
ncbi:MAG: hypothetical protein DRP95_06210 [Candidatus Latescibacterota bacterium]|nr:MAG: hypothetical protein DRP95_06210 [Candidatus Latescibacterota bacterium]